MPPSPWLDICFNSSHCQHCTTQQVSSSKDSMRHLISISLPLEHIPWFITYQNWKGKTCSTNRAHTDPLGYHSIMYSGTPGIDNLELPQQLEAGEIRCLPRPSIWCGRVRRRSSRPGHQDSRSRFKIKFIYAASSAVAGEHLGDKCLLARGGASKNVSNRGSGLILFNLCSQQMGRAGSHLYVAILVSDVLDGCYGPHPL